jgi:hypothetical protein
VRVSICVLKSSAKKRTGVEEAGEAEGREFIFHVYSTSSVDFLRVLCSHVGFAPPHQDRSNRSNMTQECASRVLIAFSCRHSRVVFFETPNMFSPL